MSENHLMKIRTWRTTTSVLVRGLLAASVALLFVGSCTSDHKNLTEPTKGFAHIPSFSTVQSTSGATFTTDKDDYSPGDTLKLSGTAWPANDSLDVLLDESPQNHPPVSWAIGTDGSGSFTDASYVVQDLDAGVTFTITATSRASGDSVQATFTDKVYKSPITWDGNGKTDAKANTFLDDPDLTPSPGQQGGLFIL